jgi:hypothetical protein
MVGGGVGQVVGPVSSIVSVLNDPSTTNKVTTVATTVLGFAVEGSDVPIGFATAAVKASEFAANTITIPVFTPGPVQATDTNINGTTVQLDDDLLR